MSILHEYAVDPALFSDKETARSVLDGFGFSRARLVARCPKDWMGRAFRAADQCKDPIRRQYVRERLIQGGKDKFARRLLPHCDEAEGLPWLQGAEARYDKDAPFEAILARQNERNHAAVLAICDIDENTPLWRVQTDAQVERDAAALADCLAPVILNAKWLAIIDPFFAPSKPAFRETLWELLSVAKQRADPGIVVQLHFSDRAFHADRPDSDFREECLTYQSDFVPEGLHLECLRWQEVAFGDELHDRFVLTDMGGAQIGAGVAEAKSGATTRASLLSDEFYSGLVRDFDPSSAKYKLVDTVSLPLSPADVDA